MPLGELKTYITPTAAELKKATEKKQAGDPAMPLEEQKAAIDALGPNFTFEQLEQCLPDKGHPAMLTIRRAGNGTSGRGFSCKRLQSLFQLSQAESYCEKLPRSVRSNKPTHTGGECKMRGPTQRGGSNNFTKSKSRTPTNGKRANPPRNANNNRPRDPRKPKVNVVKPVVYVANPATERKFDEVDDAWAGLTVERMIEDNPQLGQIAVEELYKLPPETIKIPAAQEGTPNEPPAKKQKGDEEALKPLKRCAHIDINDERTHRARAEQRSGRGCEQTHQGEGWVDHLRRRGGSGLHGDVEEAMDLHGHVVIALAVDGDEERDNTESCERYNYYKRVSRFRSDGGKDIGC
eukprot:g56528.t1